MRQVIAVATLILSGCTTLVSTSPSDFPNGYATVYTGVNFSRTGEACNRASLTYYKRNLLSQEHWIARDYPYYAAAGTYHIALWCQAPVDPQSGQCLDVIYVDSGGSETKVSLEAGRSYVVYCSGSGVKVEDREAFDRTHKSSE